MNQNEWCSGADLSTLLDYLKDDLRPRKFRLFACACLRRLRDRTDDLHFRRTVDLAERYVEGDCSRETFRTAFRRAWPDGWERARIAALVAIDPMQRDNYSWRCLELANEVIDVFFRKPLPLGNSWPAPAPNRESQPLRREQIDALREIVGNPLAPVAFDPAWRTEDVVRLSESIAVDGSFEDLPILADALEDAGCSATAILDHFRMPGRHALGCWALDLVRGRR